MDIVTYILCKKYAQSYTEKQIASLGEGMHYKGTVSSFEDLPTSAELGDLYTTSDLGREYVWTKNEDGTGAWQELNKLDLSNLYTKDEVDEKLTQKADKSQIPNKVSQLTNDKGYLVNSDLAAYAKTTDVDTKLAKKQDKLTAATGEDFGGIIIKNNVISRDPEVIPSVDYVDASISDTMLYIMQEINTERAGRIAGDNLKQDKITDLDDIRAGAQLGTTAVQHNELILEKGSGLNSFQVKDSQCFATGDYSTATGYGTQAQANYSKASGFTCRTLKNDEEGIDARYSRADGYMTDAAGLASSTDGDTTHTQNIAEHAQGRGNVSHKKDNNFGSAGNTLHSIGIASNNQDVRTFKNAEEIMQNGDQYILGIGNYDGKNIDTAKTIQEVIANKQDTLKVNEENPTTELTSLTIGDIIYKIAGTAVVGKTFTTDITVGHLTAGTTISTSDTIASLLCRMLINEDEKINLYFGGSDNIPVNLSGLTKVSFDSAEEFMPVWQRNIVRNSGADGYGQFAVIALPKNYEVTNWVVAGFEYSIEYEKVIFNDYNIYYIISKGDDSPEGINYKITIEESV